MDRLVITGHLEDLARRQLNESYRFLRQVEHRLQMVNDRQTHSLPVAGEPMNRIARFMGYADSPSFALEVLRHIEVVRANYHSVFEYVPALPGADAVGPELDFRGDAPEPPATVAALAELGFREPQRIVAAVRRWLAGRVRALRSSRARDLMTTMVPAILAALGRQPDPDGAFSRFDRFVSALPTGVQPMSLFQHNPILLDRVASVLGAAPMLSEHLARNPSALEGLLAAEDLTDVRRMLRGRMTDVTRLEDAIQVTQRAVKERDFFLSVATLEGRLDADVSGLQRTELAEAALSLLVPRVLADFSTRFGRVPGGSMVVVALGKAGGREMMAGSDLDLMFIYHQPVDATESRVTKNGGARALPASQWFVRAVQSCIAAMTAPGPEGQMYALDMRLRPSGNKGPLAVSLDAFRRYHDADAWTWERMALTRARVIAGPAALRAQVNAAIETAIAKPVDGQRIRDDAVAMRARMTRELHPFGRWDMKLRAGGLIDIEFIAQVLQLLHARDKGFRRSQTTRVALRRLGAIGAIDAADAGELIAAERLWRTIQGMLRMTVGHPDGAELPHATALPLLEATAAVGVAARDTDALLAAVDAVALRVRGLFERYVGVVG
jgi:glutamate-ammonia-ligase adenylyltransferase